MEIKIEDLTKNVMYTAVGAVVVAAEKAQEILEECRVKGEAACEKYAIKNEELKRNAAEAFKKAVNVTVVVDEDENPKAEDIVSKMGKLSKEDLAKVKEKLSELEKEEQVASDGE